MRTQRRDIEIRLRADEAAAARALTEHAEWTHALSRRNKGASIVHGLSVRVRDDGQLRARINESNRFNAPPRLVGRITEGPNGVVLDATITESFNEVSIPRMFIGLAVLMAAIGLLPLTGGEFTNPAVYVGPILGILFGGLGYWQARQRRDSFRISADQLEHAIRQAVPAYPAPAGNGN